MKKAIIIVLCIFCCFLSSCRKTESTTIGPNTQSQESSSSPNLNQPINSDDAILYDYNLAINIDKWCKNITKDDFLFIKMIYDQAHIYKLDVTEEGRHLIIVLDLFYDYYDIYTGNYIEGDFEKHYKTYTKSYDNLSNLNKQGFEKYSGKKLKKIFNNAKTYNKI